ncbi:MAG: DUF433 domain-containing protein [Chitinophagaceae bacterium]|nr:DUF433 domain-containing protein [Chitinophagaceae bacterium]
MTEDKSKNIQTALPKIGEGIFLTKDVSSILLLPYAKVRHLLKSFWHGNAFGDDKNLAINFYALIEFYTFFQLRELGVPTSEIKKAHSILSKDLNVKYPFALSGIQTDGKKIWYETLGNLIKIDGKKQYAIKEFIKQFLHKVEFGENSLAKRFYPLSNTKQIVVDPMHQFGQPTISGRNITISTIKKLNDAGETINEIALLYDIKETQVVKALEYYKRSA